MRNGIQFLSSRVPNPGNDAIAVQSRPSILVIAVVVALGLGACGGTEPAADTEETETPGAGTTTEAEGARSDQTLQFVTFGGSYGESINEHFIRPFTEQTGIQVEQGENTTLAGIKSQVLSGNVQWDLAELPGGQFWAGVEEGLFEPLDYDVIDVSKVPAEAVEEYGILYALFLTGIGYDRDVIAPADAPKNWAEFWDLERWPGDRGMGEAISNVATLEYALLADGVPIDQLYPLDVERALNKLEELGDNIFWYPDNQEPINFLQRGQGPLTMVAFGRVALANAEGGNLGVVYNQMQLAGDYLVVPKGAPNPELAYEMINFMLTNSEAAVNWMKATSYGISNSEAIEMLPPDVAAIVPYSKSLEGKYYLTDYQWWAENLETTTLRFQEWLVSR